MITLHHLNNSRSQRILWLFEELGLDYEIVKHQRDSVTRLAPDALKAIHPLGTMASGLSTTGLWISVALRATHRRSECSLV